MLIGKKNPDLYVKLLKEQSCFSTDKHEAGGKLLSWLPKWNVKSRAPWKFCPSKKKQRSSSTSSLLLVEFVWAFFSSPPLCLVFCLAVLWGSTLSSSTCICVWAAVGALRLWSVEELCSGALSRSVLQRAPAATTVPAPSSLLPPSVLRLCFLTLGLTNAHSFWEPHAVAWSTIQHKARCHNKGT